VGTAASFTGETGGGADEATLISLAIGLSSLL